jgi:hypothetical protein
MTEPVREPPITFSPWTRWVEHTAIPNIHLPGVYLLAVFEAPPPRRVDPLAEAIVCIGESSDNGLLRRLYQFGHSAFDGKPGHTGGLLYREAFGDAGESLYVAAFPVAHVPREVRPLFIRYVAQKLLWEWARTWGVAPVCNRK